MYIIIIKHPVIRCSGDGVDVHCTVPIVQIKLSSVNTE